MKRNSYTRFVHEYTDHQGQRRYCVAQWDERHAQFWQPLDRSTARLTGCSAEFAKTASGLGGYATRRQALAHARYLFHE